MLLWLSNCDCEQTVSGMQLDGKGREGSNGGGSAGELGLRLGLARRPGARVRARVSASLGR